MEETTFVKTENANHCFLFRCNGCDCLGTLEIPVETRRFSCPEDCGAVYVLWFDSLLRTPAIKCVVCPVFVDDGEEEETCWNCGEWEICTCFDD